MLSPYPRAYRAPDVRTMRMMAALVGAALGHALGYSDLLSEYRGHLAAEHEAAQVKSDLAGRIRTLIRDHALANGMSLMRTDGERLVAAGITSAEEVLRVTRD